MRWRLQSSTIHDDGALRRLETKQEASNVAVAIARRLALVILLVSCFVPALPAVAADSSEAANIFKKRCSACHTFGKGTKVGPDLKGVNDRRKREWLLKFVRSSQSVIQSGDSTAVSLFRQFKQQRMPDWTDLSPETVGAILDYFAANGPEQKQPDEYSAETATEAQIEAGRKLFFGESPLHFGGQACSSCHSIGNGFGGGASLGPNLTNAYRKHSDTALTLFLKRPCFPRAPEISTDGYLTPTESFSLKAFMARASGIQFTPPPKPAGANPASSATLSNDRKRGTP